MRSTRRASHSILPPSVLNSAVLTTPEPMSMPTVMVMSSPPQCSCSYSCLHKLAFLDHRAPGERRAAERAGIDRVGGDVEFDFAVVLAHQILQRLHRGLVL